MSIQRIDARSPDHKGIEIIQNQISRTGFNIQYVAIQNTVVSGISVQYLAVLDENIQIVQQILNHTISATSTYTFSFSTPFALTPNGALFLYGFDLVSILPTGSTSYMHLKVQIGVLTINTYQFSVFALDGCVFDYLSVTIIAGPFIYGSELQFNVFGLQELVTVDQRTKYFQTGIIGVQQDVTSAPMAFKGTLRIESYQSIDSNYKILANTNTWAQTVLLQYRLSYFYYQPCAMYCDYCLNSITQCHLCLITSLRINPPTCDCPYLYYSTLTDVMCQSCADYCNGCEGSSMYCTTCNSITQRLSPPKCLICPSNMYAVSQISNCLQCDIQCDQCQVTSQNCIACNADSLKVNPPACNSCLNGYYFISNVLKCQLCADNCHICQNNTGACIQCISDNFYLDNGICVQCSSDCQICNSKTCLLYNICTFPCATCDKIRCLTCYPEYQIIYGQCSYICPSNCTACDQEGLCFKGPSNCLRGEVNQQQQVQCTQCYQNYFLQRNYCLICSIECLTCLFQYNACTVCRFSQLHGTQCQLCEIKPGYYSDYNTNTCYTICGDGVIAGTEECDDGNIYSAYGCSNCRIQPGYACKNSICELIVYPMPIIQQNLQYDSPYNSEKLISLTYNTPIKNQIINIELSIVDVDFTYEISCINSQEFNIRLCLSGQSQNAILIVNFMTQVYSKFGIEQQILQIQCPISDYIALTTLESLSIDSTEAAINYLLIILLVFVCVAILFGGLDIFWNLLDLLQTMSYLKYINTFKPLFLYQFLSLFGFMQFQNLLINRILNITLTNYIDIEVLPQTSLYIFLDGYSTCTIINVIPLLTILITGYSVYFASRIWLKISNLDIRYCIEILHNHAHVLNSVLYLRQYIQISCDKFQRTWIWTGIIRLFISITSDISFSIALGLYGYDVQQNSFILNMNNLFTLALLFVFLKICYALTIMAGFQYSMIKLSRYGSVHESLKFSLFAKYYNIFLVYKKFLFMLSLVLLYNHPLYQIGSIIVIQVIQIMYLLLVEPIENRLERTKQVICEIFMLIADVLMALLVIDEYSKYLNNDKRKLIGWFCVVSLVLIIVTQLFLDLFQQLLRYYNKYPLVKKLLRYLKNVINQQQP